MAEREPSADVERLRAAREAIGPDVELYVDHAPIAVVHAARPAAWAQD